MFKQKDRVRYAAVYVEDQWTRGRMTLQGALRYDRAWSYSPEQQIGPTNFLPDALRFPRTPGVNAYKDLSPRGGVAYDLFGNGRTAVKVNFGKYLEPASNLNGNYSISNPIARIATTTSRTWTDNGTGGPGTPGFGDFVPQCNLLDRDRQRRMRADELADLRHGDADDGGASIRRSSTAGACGRATGRSACRCSSRSCRAMSVEVGYFRRWLTNFTTTDNEALTSADFTEFAFTAPVDSRLPNGGGYVVSGLYNVTAAGFVRPPSNNITFAEQLRRADAGLQRRADQPERPRRERADVPGRHQHRQDGQRLLRRAFADPGALAWILRRDPVTDQPVLQDRPGFITKVTGLASYTVPRVDVLLAATLRSDQGAPLRATMNAPVAIVSAALGACRRPVAGTTVPIDLVAPGEVWGDRVNELNLRFAKILRFGRRGRTSAIDVFNVLNSDAILTYNQTFSAGGAWLAPQSVLTPRFMKVSAQIDF